MKPSTRVSRPWGWHLGRAGVLLALTLLFLSDVGPLSAAGVDGYNGYVVDMVVTPEEPAAVYVLTSWAGYPQPYPYGKGIYKSRDGGRTWAAVETRGLPLGYELRSLALDYSNPATLYLATSGPYDGDSGRYSGGVYQQVAGGPWLPMGRPFAMSAVA